MSHTILTTFRSASITVTDFRCDGCDAGRSVEECASGHELSITRRGAWLRRNSQGKHLGDPTRAVFFNDGSHYEVEHPVGGGDHCTAIAYAPAALDDVASELGIALDPEVSPFSAPWVEASAQLQLLVRQLDVSVRCKVEHPLACEEICLQILAQALRAATPERRGRRSGTAARRERHRTLAHDALIEIARRFHEPVLLADLARALDCSSFHLARVFKEQTGQSIHRRLMDLRLSAALEEVAASRRHIATIAHELGFCDHAHLCGAFARHYGMSPSKLRHSVTSKRSQ